MVRALYHAGYCTCMSTYPNTLSLHYPQASKLRVRPSAARSARWQGEYVSTQFIARLSSCHQTIALGSESKPGWLSSVNRLKAVMQRGVRALSHRWEEWNLKCVCVCVCVLKWAVIHAGYSLIQTNWGSGVQARDWLQERGSSVRGYMTEHIHRNTHTFLHC